MYSHLIRQIRCHPVTLLLSSLVLAMLLPSLQGYLFVQAAAPNSTAQAMTIRLLCPDCKVIYTHQSIVIEAIIEGAGAVQRVRFLTDKGAIVQEVTKPPFKIGWNSPNIGEHQVIAEVVDDTGNTKGSETITIQVVKPPASDPNPMIYNGISVGQTKLYDERSLTLMLQTAQAKLNNIDFFDQKSISEAINKFQGARLDTSALSANVTTTPIPGVTTTTNTGSTATVNEVVTQPSTAAGALPPSPSVATTTNTVSPNTVSETVTRPAVTPPSPSLPAQTSAFTFQPAFGLAPQTLLAQQMMLNYEIANLRLLLEGAVSDRIISRPISDLQNSPIMDYARSRATVGFQISLDSPQEYKDAVAEVEITIISKTSTRPPSLVSVIPREGSYNVATISKDAKQFGLGVAVQPISFGLSTQKTSEQLYLIQDQDTVAFERVVPKYVSNAPVTNSLWGIFTRRQKPASYTPEANSVTFGWQFRPVLGQKTVRSGVRQVYVTLAFPNQQTEDFIGAVEVRTHWRKYNSKKKLVDEVIAYSQNSQRLPDLVISHNFAGGEPLTPHIEQVEWEEAGQGKASVRIRGSNFLPGTKVLVGDQLLETSQNGFYLHDERNLRFIVPLQQLAVLDEVFLIGQIGPAVALHNSLLNNTEDCLSRGFVIEMLEAKPIDTQMTKVTVTLKAGNKDGQSACSLSDFQTNTRPIVLVGNTVYGTKEKPITIERKDKDRLIIFTAPTSDLKTAGRVIVRTPFLGESFKAEKTLPQLAAVFNATKVTLLSKSDSKVSLAISGSNFTDKVTVIADDKPIPVSADATVPSLNRINSNLLILRLSAEQFKTLKQIIVQQEKESVPTATASQSQPSPQAQLPLQPQKASQKVKRTTPKVMSSTTEKPLPKTEDSPKEIVSIILPLEQPIVIPKPKVIFPQVSIGNEADIQVTGTNLASIEKIIYLDRSLIFKVADKGESMTVRLIKALTESQGQKAIDLILKDGSKVAAEISITK